MSLKDKRNILDLNLCYEIEDIPSDVKDDEEVIKEKLDKAGKGVLPVLVTGKGGFPDSTVTMKILKKLPQECWNFLNFLS